MRVLRRVPLATLLVLVWVLLWGSASPANILSGIVIVLALFAMYPMERPVGPHRFHPLGFAVLALTYAWSMASATVIVAAAVLGPRKPVRKGLIEVTMATNDPVFITMVSNLIALTPGSIVVRIRHRPEGVVLWVHILTLQDPEQVVAATRTLERRCVRAFGTSEQIALVNRTTDTSNEEGPAMKGDLR